MNTQEAVAHYGGVKKLADALGVWPQVVYAWGERPPMSRLHSFPTRRSSDDRKSVV